MVITFPNDTKDTIDEIRNAIGRNVIIQTIASSTACPDCSLDPITNTSTDSFCLTCSGVYWIPIYSGYSVLAHITWGQSEILNWQSAGQLFDGDCRIQVEYSDSNVTVLDNAEYITVDGRDFEIKSKIYRGVPELNRIIVDLKERE